MIEPRPAAEDMAFLQALGGRPWTSECGRVQVTRGRLSEWDEGLSADTIFNYWLVSCTTPVGIGVTIVLRDNDAPLGGVEQRLDDKIDEFLNLANWEP